MTRRGLLWALAALLGLLPVPAWAGEGLAERIDAIIRRPNYRDSRWGILVADARTGETVYEHNADQLMLPGSTLKLFYAAAALADLGPDYRFETPVYRTGPVVNGHLEGSLVLVASGDLTLGGRDDGRGHMAFTDDDHTYANFVGSESTLTSTDPLAGLRSLAEQVAMAGIRRVDDVLIDDRLFRLTRASGTGAGVLSPIVVNDNVLDLLVEPGDRIGEAPRVTVRPGTSFFRVDVEATTAPPGYPTRLEVVPRGLRRLAVRGQIARDSRPVLRSYAIEDPAAFARALFIETLYRAGVQVAASPAQPPRESLPPPDTYGKQCPRVAVFQSLPLSELIKVTLKASVNVYADSFPLVLAARRGRTTLGEGMYIQREALEKIGVRLNGASVTTASGLSGNDAVSARAMVQLLLALEKHPDRAALFAGLPILGKDGTLADAVSSSSPARGKVQAKTGTALRYEPATGRSTLLCKSLVGKLTTASGRPLVFALFVNGVSLPPGENSQREGRVLGRICEILYEFGG